MALLFASGAALAALTFMGTALGAYDRFIEDRSV